MWAELASFFFLLRAFFPPGFTTVLATYPYIALAAGLPASYSGVGVREGAVARLLSPYAVPSGAAVDFSLVWFLYAVLLPAALGAFWLVAERTRCRVRNSDKMASKAAPSWIPLAASQAPTLLGPHRVVPRGEAG
jgi:uncharacterized membrane protein YbhN (UPF0104 family)